VKSDFGDYVFKSVVFVTAITQIWELIFIKSDVM